jgi:UDP-galactopyranose mutase
LEIKEAGKISISKGDVMFDYIIIGAGLSGAVMAERIANKLGQKVLMIEQRSHIGGNAYDRYDDQGLQVHHYGPHIFHTKLKYVWDYLSSFTEWREYHHRVLGSIDGQQVPIPFNINSLRKLFPQNLCDTLEEKLIANFGFGVKVPILKLRDTADADLKWLADFVYEKVFLRYTLKQWGLKPEELDSGVTGRVPVFVSKDDRYFQDAYQGIPKHGYTRMFERMLAHPNIKLMLNTHFQDILKIDFSQKKVELFGQPYKGKIIYTGKVDELFDYVHGELPYRSLRFDFETFEQPFYQETGTVNYPNEYDYTRITEFKHLTGQQHEHTTVVREYPQEYNKDIEGKNIPYYPIPMLENQEKYEKYYQMAKQNDQFILLGRLAEYKYFDMDACVAKALKVFNERILKE